MKKEKNTLTPVEAEQIHPTVWERWFEIASHKATKEKTIQMSLGHFSPLFEPVTAIGSIRPHLSFQ
jgi:hypothetical protein